MSAWLKRLERMETSKDWGQLRPGDQEAISDVLDEVVSLQVQLRSAIVVLKDLTDECKLCVDGKAPNRVVARHAVDGGSCCECGGLGRVARQPETERVSFMAVGTEDGAVLDISVAGTPGLHWSKGATLVSAQVLVGSGSWEQTT